MYTLIIRIAAVAAFLIVTSAVLASTAMAVTYGARCVSSSLKGVRHEPSLAMRVKSRPWANQATLRDLSKGAKV